MEAEAGLWKRISAWLIPQARAGNNRRPCSPTGPVQPKRKAASDGQKGKPPAPGEVIPRKYIKAPNTYIFSLAPFREKLGTHWEAYGPSVHRIAGRLFSAKLASMGTMERYGDSYVIIFDRLKGGAARAAGDKFHRQFQDLIYQGTGCEELAESGPRSGNAESGAAGSGPNILRRLYNAVSRFFKKGAPSAVDDGAIGQDSEDAGTSREPMPNKAASQGKRSASAGKASRSGTAAKPSSARPAGPRPPGSPPDQTDGYKEVLKRRREARSIENAMMAEVLRRKMEWSKEMETRLFPPPDLSFIYRSMWNLKSEYITTYTSVPICWKDSMEVAHGEDVIPLPRRRDQIFELDRLSLENAIGIVHDLEELKSNALLMAGVHASTLSNEAMLREYMATAETIRQSARRNLIFEILDIGEYAFQVEATRMVKLMSSVGRAVSASVGLDDRSFAFWKQCGITAVGADLSRDKRSEPEITSRFGHFVTQAKRHNLECYLRELDKRSQAIFADSSGFDFVEGAVIGSGGSPDNLVLTKFSLENLYEDKTELIWAA